VKFMLDSNVYDLLVASPDAKAAAMQRSREGRDVLLMTHVQNDELREIPDREKRTSIADIPTQIVPTYGVVFDVSAIAHASVKPRRSTRYVRAAAARRGTRSSVQRLSTRRQCS